MPIYDDANGELFGAVNLAVDLEYLLAEWSRDTAAQSVLLADRQGKVMAVFQPESGRDFTWRPEDSTAVLPASFVDSRQTEYKMPPTAPHPGGLFAIKVPIDPRHPENFVILIVRGE